MSAGLPESLRGPLAMRNEIMTYTWGSKKAIARLQKRVPTGQREAELWMGAHPRAPSTVRLDGQTVPLDQAIERWPQELLGGQGELPFLLKVLAVEEALSVQCHPDAEQAAAGFAREEAAGIARDAPDRCYRDPRAKPELVVALSDFHTLCGFRPWEGARALLDAAGLPWTSRRQAVQALLDPQSAPLVRAALRRLDASHPDLAALIRSLDDQHHGDPGALFPLLLQPVTLRPGQALYLPAGQLHCYLHGVAVEVMGNSDNVLRGGLTVKHKDPAELMAVLDWDAGPPPVIEPDADGVYPTPTDAFRLRLADHRVTGPAVVLVTGGALYLKELRLISGDSAFVPVAAGPLPLGGNGAGFVVTAGG